MIIFPDYVSSFTSKYTMKASTKKIVENATENGKGFQIVSKEQDGESQRFLFNFGKKHSIKRFFFPSMKATVTEKADGTLVFVRLDASAPLKMFACFIVFLLVAMEWGLIALTATGNISFVYPLVAIPVSVLLCKLIERIWAKLCCIKAYRHLCNALDHKPPKVMIIKVLKK